MTIKQISSGGGEFTITTPTSTNNRTITLPDATTTLVGTDAAQTLTNKTIIDSGGLSVISGTTGIGYGTGAGGTVTQTTSKSTAVTLNTLTGQIITSSEALASNATVAFQFNNSQIKQTDLVVFTLGDSNGLSYNVWAYNIQNGYCNVAIRNISGGSLSNAIPIKFAIIKGATS